MDVSFAQQKEKNFPNPFTATAVKFPGLKDAWMRLQNSAFSGLITHLLLMLCVLIKKKKKNPFTCQCEKEDKISQVLVVFK